MEVGVTVRAMIRVRDSRLGLMRTRMWGRDKIKGFRFGFWPL